MKKTVGVAALLVLAGTSIACLSDASHGRVELEAIPGNCGATVIGGGVIARDARTRSDIESSQDVVIPTDEGELSLVLTKSCYRLDVLLDGQRLKTYPVALGDTPTGAKRRSGDERTPEGTYWLAAGHESPNFGRSFYVSYPGPQDAKRARERGRIDQAAYERILLSANEGRIPPHDTVLGGLILIHGTKHRTKYLPLTRMNWTDGCVAMENDDLDELLVAFDRSATPAITIRP